MSWIMDRIHTLGLDIYDSILDCMHKQPGMFWTESKAECIVSK